MSCQAVTVKRWLSDRASPSSVLLGTPSTKVQVSKTGSGLGLFATRHIEAFSVLLSDAPLILMEPEDDLPELYQKFTRLGRGDQEKYLNLSYHENPSRDALLKDKLLQRGFGKEGLQEMAQVAGIMQNNAFNVDLGDGRGSCHRALFPHVARLNHSCIPNAHVCFYPEQSPGRMVVHTLRPLEADEEIRISYFSILLPYAERQAKAQKWGFTCRCSGCDERAGGFEGSESQRRMCRDFATRQGEMMKRAVVTMMELNDVAGMGRAAVYQAKREDGLVPTLPDLFDGLAMLQAKVLLVQKRETERDSVLSLLEEAVEWEARITGTRSQATSKRLRRLAQFAQKQGPLMIPAIELDASGSYRVKWPQ
ncbi:Histone-lysine N-methyltransferase ATXR2 [Fulvia fulva]|uniref:Histone-lysine N-methyltransferase ATXR2 n=1 Tax=Passalora fulva TaxID=5499 RepID=A0A9Q8L7B0_PASFU|nr:Histone-lysine N-methyltransferase ATXR2 [Fulvia fulva]KAK4635485.1 Histone-lysine N-methyltransferase ATXR2 [Fulvia fulva]KAK4636689.1 Histone-lysine N-methyltransferase ATXR2 [Fulvia fulva]UJO12132.1 Histone-lysine N-methyltransferase ATXR2 [Fulvia fulva]WPV08802.1 Histone-lysine N-methyltransferase ATXR2 [Fulvia fulva]WPV24280.1 Histone-lysine N-methyltransferase ATXR2 [Fulvia fulva]